MTVLAHLQDTLCKSKSQNRRSRAGETCTKATLSLGRNYVCIGKDDNNDASG